MKRPSLPAFIVVVSLVVTGLVWTIHPPDYLQTPVPEFAAVNSDYQGQVRDLLHGLGFRYFRYPPIYPLFLVAIFEVARLLGLSPHVLLAIASLASVATSAVLLYLIARHLWRPAVAAAVSFLWITYPPALYLTTFAASETPFIVLLLLAVLLAFRAISVPGKSHACCFASGIAAGLAMLTRPIALGLGVILALFTPILAPPERSRSWRLVLGLAILVGNLIAVLPWEAWALRKDGRLILLSTGGVPSLLDGLTYAVDPKDHRGTPVPPDVRSLQEAIYAQQYRQLNSLKSISAFLALEFRERPVSVIKLFLLKAMNAWYRSDSGAQDRRILIVQLPYLALFLTSSVVAWRRRRPSRRVIVFLWCIVIQFWLLTILALTILRYMTPAIAVLFLLAPALLPSEHTTTGSALDIRP